MKIILDQKTVYRACMEEIPSPGPDGKPVSWGPAPVGTRSVFLIDGHRDAPRGFGLRIQKSTKTYFAEKRVNGKNIRFKLCDAKGKGGIKLEDARELAHNRIREAIDLGESPNKARKSRLAAEISLNEAWDDYLAALAARPKPPKANTYASINKARARLEKERPDWGGRKIRTLTGQEVVDVFNQIAGKHRTTAEQVGRWASAAVMHAIRMETHNAQTRGTPPTLTYDPFSILGNKGLALYRTKTQLEEDYQAKGVRNPLDAESLGKFIRACWTYRRQNILGADFLLITLLLGARRGEACKFVWRDKVNSVEAAENSYVDLVKRLAHFHDPKNRISFDQPLGSCAFELLQRRHEDSVSKWVFPARDPRSAYGYYSDPSVAMNTVKSIAGLDGSALRPHDLRRTLGRVAESMNYSDAAIKTLLGHNSSDVTSRYTAPEWKTKVERMERVEQKMLSTAPDVYNDLKPSGRKPMEVRDVPTLTLPPSKPRRRRVKAKE